MRLCPFTARKQHFCEDSYVLWSILQEREQRIEYFTIQYLSTIEKLKKGVQLLFILEFFEDLYIWASQSLFDVFCKPYQDRGLSSFSGY